MNTRSVPGVFLSSEKATRFYRAAMALSELDDLLSNSEGEVITVNHLVELLSSEFFDLIEGDRDDEYPLRFQFFGHEAEDRVAAVAHLHRQGEELENAIQKLKAKIKASAIGEIKTS